MLFRQIYALLEINYSLHTGEGAPAEALRGDISATNFWATGQETIFDVRVTDTDNRTEKVLKKQEGEKKAKYSEACQEARLHFTPLVYSVDGMEGKEATAARKRLASMLAEKWKKEYSQVCGFIRSRLSVLALVRATSQCLRGTRDPLMRRVQNPEWVAHEGLRLFN